MKYSFVPDGQSALSGSMEIYPYLTEQGNIDEWVRVSVYLSVGKPGVSWASYGERFGDARPFAQAIHKAQEVVDLFKVADKTLTLDNFKTVLADTLDLHEQTEEDRKAYWAERKAEQDAREERARIAREKDSKERAERKAKKEAEKKALKEAFTNLLAGYGAFTPPDANRSSKAYWGIKERMGRSYREEWVLYVEMNGWPRDRTRYFKVDPADLTPIVAKVEKALKDWGMLREAVRDTGNRV